MEKSMEQDNFFEEISNDKPFLKMALEGFAGSGKSYTGALIAIGLHQRIKSTKPVVIFDTEKGSSWLRPLFEKAKIKVMIKQSRNLTDLVATMNRVGSIYPIPFKPNKAAIENPMIRFVFPFYFVGYF